MVTVTTVVLYGPVYSKGPSSRGVITLVVHSHLVVVAEHVTAAVLRYSFTTSGDCSTGVEHLSFVRHPTLPSPQRTVNCTRHIVLFRRTLEI